MGGGGGGYFLTKTLRLPNIVIFASNQFCVSCASVFFVVLHVNKLHASFHTVVWLAFISCYVLPLKCYFLVWLLCFDFLSNKTVSPVFLKYFIFISNFCLLDITLSMLFELGLGVHKIGHGSQ